MAPQIKNNSKINLLWSRVWNGIWRFNLFLQVVACVAWPWFWQNDLVIDLGGGVSWYPDHDSPWIVIGIPIIPYLRIPFQSPLKNKYILLSFRSLWLLFILSWNSTLVRFSSLQHIHVMRLVLLCSNCCRHGWTVRKTPYSPAQSVARTPG